MGSDKGDEVTALLSVHCEVIPAAPSSWPWVLETFRGKLERIDGGPALLAREQTAALRRILQTGAGRAVVSVPRGHSDDFLGWAVALDGFLLFAYVRDEFRRQGLGSQLACAITNSVPMGLAYWTRDAEAISAHGYPIAYSIHAYQALLGFVRKERRSPYVQREGHA